MDSQSDSLAADKPRGKGRPYTPAAKAAMIAKLAAAMETTAGANMPEGSLRQASSIVGLPLSTAHDWISMSDEGFGEARRSAKKAIHGDALEIVALASQAVRQRLRLAMESPDDLRKLNPRDLIVVYGTAYDKASLAAGEGQSAALAAVGAAVVAQLWSRTQSAPMASTSVDVAPVDLP